MNFIQNKGLPRKTKMENEPLTHKPNHKYGETEHRKKWVQCRNDIRVKVASAAHWLTDYENKDSWNQNHTTLTHSTCSYTGNTLTVLYDYPNS